MSIYVPMLLKAKAMMRYRAINTVSEFTEILWRELWEEMWKDPEKRAELKDFLRHEEHKQQ